MIKQFSNKYRHGDTLVMPVGEHVKDIRFNLETREISFTCEEDFDSLSAKQLRKLVEDKGGKYKNKKTAVAFLTK